MTKKEKYIPINKGHFFDLEPPERVKAFSEKLSKGWEEEYKEYRLLWNELPKKRIVRDYPLLVDLETVSRCNLSCPMCPTVTKEFVDKRVTPFKRGQLDVDLAKKVIDEVAGKIYSLRFSWIGEPTLHKHLPELIKYATDTASVAFITHEEGAFIGINKFKRNNYLREWKVNFVDIKSKEIVDKNYYDKDLKKIITHNENSLNLEIYVDRNYNLFYQLLI